MKSLKIIVCIFSLIFALPAMADGESLSVNDVPRELRTLISERLSVMPGVAKFKWNKKIPVEDLARERVILEGLVAKAERAGVSPNYADKFFKDQIAAAKMIQWGLIEKWRVENHPPFTDVPDLKATVRPALDRLTGRILILLAEVQNKPLDAESQTLLKTPPATWASQPKIWERAVSSLLIGKES